MSYRPGDLSRILPELPNLPNLPDFYRRDAKVRDAAQRLCPRKQRVQSSGIGNNHEGTKGTKTIKRIVLGGEPENSLCLRVFVVENPAKAAIPADPASRTKSLTNRRGGTTLEG